MNIIELLEFAAQAIGLPYIKPTEDYDGSLGLAAWENPMRTYTWDPVRSNHDAFCLAAKLGLHVFFPDAEPTAVVRFYPYNESCRFEECVLKHDGDKEAATRFAIVRVAAAIWTHSINHKFK